MGHLFFAWCRRTFTPRCTAEGRCVSAVHVSKCNRQKVACSMMSPFSRSTFLVDLLTSTTYAQVTWQMSMAQVAMLRPNTTLPVAARLVLRRARAPRTARCTRCAGTPTTSRRCCASLSCMHSRRRSTLHCLLRVYRNNGYVHAVWCVEQLRAYQLARDTQAATAERNRARRGRNNASKSRPRLRGPGAARFRQRTCRPTLQ